MQIAGADGPDRHPLARMQPEAANSDEQQLLVADLTVFAGKDNTTLYISYNELSGASQANVPAYVVDYVTVVIEQCDKAPVPASDGTQAKYVIKFNLSADEHCADIYRLFLVLGLGKTPC